MPQVKYTAIVFYRHTLKASKYRNVVSPEKLLKWCDDNNPKLLHHINFYDKETGRFVEQRRPVEVK